MGRGRRGRRRHGHGPREQAAREARARLSTPSAHPDRARGGLHSSRGRWHVAPPWPWQCGGPKAAPGPRLASVYLCVPRRLARPLSMSHRQEAKTAPWWRLCQGACHGGLCPFFCRPVRLPGAFRADLPRERLSSHPQRGHPPRRGLHVEHWVALASRGHPRGNHRVTARSLHTLRRWACP